MSQASSIFLSGRVKDECRSFNAAVAVYYPGTTNAVPVLENGMISFKGGVASVNPRGIEFTGYSDNDYRLPYLSIPGGGAGVKYRGTVTDVRNKIRVYVKQKPGGVCGTNRGIISFQLRPTHLCTTHYQYNEETPLSILKQCNIMETNCQITEWLAREINREYGHLGTAMKVQDEDGVHAVDITALNVGDLLYVDLHEGLDVSVITPMYINRFSKKTMQDQMSTQPLPEGVVIYNGANDGSLNIVELFPTIKVNSSFLGVATSNMSNSTTTTMDMSQHHVIIFENNTNGNAALDALKLILAGPASSNTASDYLAVAKGLTTQDVMLYPYTVIRTDAGSVENIATVRTDYPSAKKVSRIGYIGGKSYYEIYTTTADTLPPATTSSPSAFVASDDVDKGTVILPDRYSVSACTDQTPCVDCPPSNYTLIGGVATA